MNHDEPADLWAFGQTTCFGETHVVEGWKIYEEFMDCDDMEMGQWEHLHEGMNIHNPPASLVFTGAARFRPKYLRNGHQRYWWIMVEAPAF